VANTIGIIGGSGLYEMEGLGGVREVSVETPFGPPSDLIVSGTLGGARLYFLPRHGRGHRLLPSEVPYRANVWALKSLGVERIISVSAVGSLREDVVPGQMMIPDQFLDLTRKRESTFFGEGCVAHVGYGDPVCPHLAGVLEAACREVGAACHRGGTYVCMEGPQFSTKAESRLYRSWGASVIGMTNATEAKLSREAELSYATLALVTDYDCWHLGHDAVTADQIVAVLLQNVANAKKILRAAIPNIQGPEQAPLPRALASAIVTDPKVIPGATRKKLELLIGPYLKK